MSAGPLVARPSQGREETARSLSKGRRTPRRPASGLVVALASGYLALMVRSNIRRVFASLMAVVLAVGFAVHDLSGPMIVKSAATSASALSSSSGEPMRGKCNGCAGDEKGVMPSACAAFCSAVVALPTEDLESFAVFAETLVPAPGPDAIGWTHPPDPYPPRTTILS